MRLQIFYFFILAEVLRRITNRKKNPNRIYSTHKNKLDKNEEGGKKKKGQSIDMSNNCQEAALNS